MTKYEIELSENAIIGIHTLAYAIDNNLPDSRLGIEKMAIVELAKQLPPPPLPDGVYVYRGNKYLSTHFVKDGKHSSSMEADTGFMPFAVDVLLADTKSWTRIGDLPEVDNGS